MDVSSIVDRVFGFFRRRGTAVSRLVSPFYLPPSNRTSRDFEKCSFAFLEMQIF